MVKKIFLVVAFLTIATGMVWADDLSVWTYDSGETIERFSWFHESGGLETFGFYDHFSTDDKTYGEFRFSYNFNHSNLLFPSVEIPMGDKFVHPNYRIGAMGKILVKGNFASGFVRPGFWINENGTTQATVFTKLNFGEKIWSEAWFDYNMPDHSSVGQVTLGYKLNSWSSVSLDHRFNSKGSPMTGVGLNFHF